MSTGEVCSESLQAAQALEMVAHLAEAASNQQNADVLISPVVSVAGMHDYAGRSALVHMSSGELLGQQSQPVMAKSAQLPGVTSLQQQLIVPGQTDSVSITENVMSLLQQHQESQEQAKELQAKRQQTQLHQLQVDNASLSQLVQQAGPSSLQQVQMQVPQSDGQTFITSGGTVLSHEQLQQLSHEQALQVQSVISLKPYLTSQLLQLQDPKHGQHMVIGTPQVTDTSEHDTQIQLQMVVDGPEHEKKQVVLPADAPPPPIIAEDGDLEENQPSFEEPANIIYNDKLLWCQDCGAGVKTMCRTHGEVTKVKDRTIPSRAKLTAPHHVSIRVLELRAGGKHVYGVFARKVIQKRTQFGPVEGILQDTWDYKGSSRLKLKIFEKDGSSKFMDCVNQNYCNWMIFVRPAKCLNEQNLIAYQYKGSIYFTSTKAIPPNAELRVWYAKGYGTAMGAPALAQQPQDCIDTADFTVQKNVDESYEQDVDEDYKETSVQPPQELPPQEVLAVEEEGQEDDKWTCSGCSKEFSSLLSYDMHECEERSRRTRGKRKGYPIKTNKKSSMITVVSNSKRQRRASAKIQQAKEDAETNKSDKHDEDDNTNDSIVDSNPDEDDYEPTLDEEHDRVDEDQEPIAEASETQRTKRTKRKTKAGKGKGAKARSGRTKGTKGPRELFNCQHCDKAFVSLLKLQNHTIIHTGEKPFVCKYENCGKAFSSKFKQIRHELIHCGDKQHACPYCQKTFSRKDHLKNHLRVHDPNKELHRCDKCLKEYASPFAFKTHLAFHAAEEGELICGVCKEEFTEKEKLLKHLKVHAGARSVKDAAEKNQRCLLCEKLFFTKKDVKRHMVVHTKDRDFLCQFCPQRFGRRDHLVRHLNKSHIMDGSLAPFSATNESSSEIYNTSPKKARNRSQRVNPSHQGTVLDSVAYPGMSELLQTVTRGLMSDNTEIEVQVIRNKDGSSQNIMITPLSQAVSNVTNIQQSVVNYGGNMVQAAGDARPVQNMQGGREVSAVLSQPITEPIMSGHFVPPSYLPPQVENNEASSRQASQQQLIQHILQTAQTQQNFITSTQSEQQQQLAPHSIVTYSSMPSNMGLATDPGQPQKLMLAPLSTGELGEQHIQIQQGNVVFTMKASTFFEQYGQQTSTVEQQAAQ